MAHLTIRHNEGRHPGDGTSDRSIDATDNTTSAPKRIKQLAWGWRHPTDRAGSENSRTVNAREVPADKADRMLISLNILRYRRLVIVRAVKSARTDRRHGAEPMFPILFRDQGTSHQKVQLTGVTQKIR